MVFGVSFREESPEKRQKTSRWGKLIKRKKEVDNTILGTATFASPGQWGIVLRPRLKVQVGLAH
jgi:hypothetical protein